MKRKMYIISTLLTFIVLLSGSTSAKQVVAQSAATKTVILGGEAFGIKMFSDGVLVIEVEKKLSGAQDISPAVLAGIKVNDVIKSVNGHTLYSNEEFTKIIKSYKNEPINLLIERDNKYIETTITPKYDSQGTLRIGLWIKDSAAGIGTITYYDNQTCSFGALGHGICESSTGKILPISYGEIASATIKDINKSENGKVGSLNGYFEGESIGKVKINCNSGVYGVLSSEIQGEFIEVAQKDEVTTGKAQIYCTLDDNVKRPYDIEIKRLSCRGDDTMLIEITDEELLDVTGGIVQGMSGSPIVQNGKIIGALTHVLVNNVKCGYGIYLEDMLEKSA